MMLDPTDLAFFQELATACTERLGPDDPCTTASDRAVQTSHPDDLRAARLALDALSPDLREAVLRQVHHRLASNLSKIWEQLPGAPRDGPVN